MHANGNIGHARHSIRQVLCAEFIGALLLTFADAAVAIQFHSSSDPAAVFLKSIAPMGVIVAMIFCAGTVSGAHFNPAVTLAFATRSVFPWWKVPLYWTAQILGAIAGACLLLAIFGNDISAGITKPMGSVSQSFFLEITLTWFLLTAIVTSSHAGNVKGWEAAFPVGAALVVCGLIGKSISGASMNPARSLGTAIVSREFDSIWIYVVAPAIGSALGAATTSLIRNKPSEKEVRAAQGR